MATTPTYSWPIPDDTDLVKDGAEAIRDLGNAIDTTVDGLGVGLVHIETQSFSAVSGINFDGVFSAEFDTYKAYFNLVHSTDMDFNFRLRLGTSDDSTSNYSRQLFTATATATQAARISNSDIGRIIHDAGASRSIAEATFFNPFLSVPLGYLVDGSPRYNVAGEIRMYKIVGNQNVSSSFDGIRFFCSSGNVTGSISLFGVQK
jgi:hypothetical protein